MKENKQISFINVVKELEALIKERFKDKPSDYQDGYIDGLITAIRTIEG